MRAGRVEKRIDVNEEKEEGKGEEGREREGGREEGLQEA